MYRFIRKNRLNNRIMTERLHKALHRKTEQTAKETVKHTVPKAKPVTQSIPEKPLETKEEIPVQVIENALIKETEEITQEQQYKKNRKGKKHHNEENTVRAEVNTVSVGDETISELFVADEEQKNKETNIPDNGEQNN